MIYPSPLQGDVPLCESCAGNDVSWNHEIELQQGDIIAAALRPDKLLIQIESISSISQNLMGTGDPRACSHRDACVHD